MEAVKTGVSLLCHGLMHSFWGVLDIFSLDRRETKINNQQSSASRRQVSSVLAQRRNATSSDSHTPAPSEEGDSSKRKPSIKMKLLKCCLLNGLVFLASYFIVYNILLVQLMKLLAWAGLPEAGAKVVYTTISYLTGTLWVLPLFIISKVVNAIWFQELADRVYRVTVGRTQGQRVSVMVSDLVFSIVLQLLFLLQSMCVGLLPYPALGYAVYLLHVTLLYSLYAFEYKWFSDGLGVHRRLAYIEELWPYFCGFGLPLTLATELCGSFIASGGMFALLFPLFIISAHTATPPQPTWSHRLPIFSLSSRITNWVFNRVVGTS